MIARCECGFAAEGEPEEAMADLNEHMERQHSEELGIDE